MKPIPKELITKSKFWKPKLNPGFDLKSNSWFDITGLQKKGAKCKLREIKGPIIRCSKISIKPNQKQRNLLKSWLDIYRQIYNFTVKYFRKHKICGQYKARDIIRKKITQTPILWCLIKQSEIPLHTCNNAIFDVVKAYETAMINLKAGNIKYFRLRYKKITKSTHTLVFEPNTFNKIGTGLNYEKLNDLHPASKIFTECDVRLQYNQRTKQFMLHIPEYREIHLKYNRYNRCALDPGMRIFQSAYSDNGVIFQFATDKTNGSIKKLINRVEKVKSKPEKRYKKYANRLRTKIKNKVADLHWKVARFLCKRFDNIMIGNMSTKGIIKKHRSVLTPGMKRFCIALSHYKFRDRLQKKCEEFSVNFACVDESYTSKTCGKCGEMKENLGGDKIFKCEELNCGYIMNRDIHGARNILIKNT